MKPGWRHEIFLMRIEVGVGSVEGGQEEELFWDLIISRVRPNVAVLGGVLRAHNERGFGQAMVNSIIVASPDEDDSVDLKEVAEQAASIGCIEGMYDVARRAISAQAAQMDLTLDFPRAAPPAEVEIDEVDLQESGHQHPPS